MKRSNWLWAVVVLVMALLPACASSSKVFVNQNTGKVVRCSSSGWGAYGATVANMNQKNCEADAKKLGFVDIDKAAGTGLRFDTKLPTSPLVVIGCLPNSPALAAGIQADDRIIAINDIPVKTVADLQAFPRPQIGDTLRYTLIRNAKTMDVTLRAVPLSQMLQYQRLE